MDKILYSSVEAKSKFEAETEMLNLPQKQLENIVATSNRIQRRAFVRATRRRGRGYTK